MNQISFIPLPDPNLEVLHSQFLDGKLQLFVKDPSPSSECPVCHVLSTDPHVPYIRNIRDLPFNETEVELILVTQKWYCHNPDCEVDIFSQRYSWVRPRKRYTVRAEKFLLNLAVSTSCLSAEKLARSFHLPVSHDTILTLLHEAEVKPEVSPFRVNR